jgi:hypothetical protein
MVDYVLPAEYPYKDEGEPGSEPLRAADYNPVLASLADLGAAGGRVAALEADLTYLGASARIYASATGQTIANFGLDRINMSATEFATAGAFTADLTNDRIQVLNSGRYSVVWELKYTGGSSGQRYASIWRNASLVREVGTAVGTGLTISGAAVLALSANDTIEMRGYVDGGTTVTVESANSYDTGITVTYIGS